MKNLMVFVTLLIPFNSTTNGFNKIQSVEEHLEEVISKINVEKLDDITNKNEVDSLIKLNFPTLKLNLQDYQRKNYITLIRLKPVWEYMTRIYHIPKPILISFFIEETGWGKSKLFKSGYNFGGIRAKIGFAKYKTLLEGVKKWGRVMTLNRYLGKVHNCDDMLDWLKAYDKGGYWGNEDGIPNRMYHIKKHEFEKI